MSNEDNQAKLSIIIPIYNKELYLRSAIKSIEDQCYDDLEVILVDDGSTDKSSLICDELSGEYSWIKVAHQNNMGVSAARNRGLSMANGKYVLFMDADDLIAENAILDVIEIMEQSSADICFYSYSLIQGETIDQIPREWKYESDYILKHTKDFEQLFIDLLNSNIISNIGTKIYKKSILSDICFIPFNICEDVAFCIDAILRSDHIAYINKPFYLYRQNVYGSLMSGYKQNYFEAACLLINKLNNVRVRFNGSPASDTVYISYIDVVCKKMLANESTQTIKQFYKICSSIIIADEFVELIKNSGSHNLKNRIFYFVLNRNLFALIYTYYKFYNIYKTMSTNRS